tara:strand:+ start:102 stop:311 length:210 start_codon:yes stop_codon:yes gene_type:complete
LTRAPAESARVHSQHLRQLVEEFLAFAEIEYERLKDERGSLHTARGYSLRQAGALRTFWMTVGWRRTTT